MLAVLVTTGEQGEGQDQRDGVPVDAGRRTLKIGLVAVVTLVAFESLAVTTILPQIENDLGGLSWIHRHPDGNSAAA